MTAVERLERYVKDNGIIHISTTPANAGGDPELTAQLILEVIEAVEAGNATKFIDPVEFSI